MEQERIFLTPQQARDCLIVKDKQVHNFIPMGFGLCGADWHIFDVEQCLDEATSIEIGGDNCRKLGHGIVAIKGDNVYFFEADNDKITDLENTLGGLNQNE